MKLSMSSAHEKNFLRKNPYIIPGQISEIHALRKRKPRFSEYVLSLALTAMRIIATDGKSTMIRIIVSKVKLSPYTL